MKPGRKFYRRPAGITILTVLLLAAFLVPTALVLTADTENQNALEASELTEVDPVVRGEGLAQVTLLKIFFYNFWHQIAGPGL